MKNLTKLTVAAINGLVDRAEAATSGDVVASALSTDECPICLDPMDFHGLGGCEASVYLNWSDAWGDQATDFCRCTRRGE